MTKTISGSRGLTIEEPLLFEQGSPEQCGVDLEEPPAVVDRLGGLRRKAPIGLPGLAEPTVVRHYTRLSQKNFGIDSVFYPLGSCTMKHNPRLNEKMARLAGFADVHPFQPESTVQGALALIDLMAHWLKTLTGMPAVAMTPAAGAHGEFCGLMTIRAALEDRGETRTRVLVPESAHGTNPASAAACGFTVDPIPANRRGRVDLAALKSKLGPDVAAFMLTNPNTCGLFEDEILEISEAVHAAGAFFYGDGANYNAIVGRVRVADLGIDAMHINLHKTFSTPHGGGGPGAGPTVLSAALAPFAPLPGVIHDDTGFHLVEHAVGSGRKPCGRIKGYHGQFGVFIRALSYMMSMGADGLRQSASDAVLNANYLLARLSSDLTPSFEGPCMHEALFDDRFLKDSGVSTLDFAKALIDEGFHPMTMYFPLVVHGALLMEPTESESKETLDGFIASVQGLARRAKAGDGELFHNAPEFTPRRRLDETAAARSPVLRWSPAGGNGDKK
ncbi:aminomethyl-transferring glycine dehydrogenase subunit GcvPB [Telmatospirillum sp.]|uniref:aminomethyl-transferring glycine dehydrogenase subunit GcvPB n=1 Tax=Telmatospirillum sp. TaxID=2079197 RepID=UPI002843F104|nr:aminomethyl-transferring glycine dehydrogenase subunit GcvPB [Telmatospirillum sp.]MDR3435950.1 aminomethyl-transferring glycine dehydrogenase subunit GcvPB [Telmatospirillum sp.]